MWKQQQSERERSQDYHNVRSQARPCASDVKSNWPGQNDESENIARTEKRLAARYSPCRPPLAPAPVTQ
ncbi:unnamed protein product [Leptosia nina]|uniref:Uncharacterized protein n=1 Tax=Leptosia nina TaxID=320188 RepID=A0AAV1J7N1_9NEOP